MPYFPLVMFKVVFIMNFFYFSTLNNLQSFMAIGRCDWGQGGIFKKVKKEDAGK